jgi:hypothetical protein
MPTPTYTPLATVTLASAVSTVSFSSIPATYRDLILITNIRTTKSATSDAVFVRANSDSGSNYTRVGMFGNGSTTGSFTGTESGYYLAVTGNTATSGVFDMNILQIMDYSAADKHKTALLRESENQITTVLAEAQRWANTNAITTLTVVPQTGPNLAAGSTLSLYGVIA